MKVETEQVLRIAEPTNRPTSAARGWKVALPVLAAMIAAVLAVYWQTAQSMVATWGSSETFAHGYLIVPIALVLMWLRRREVAQLAPAPDYLGFVLLAGAGFAWVVAAAGQVQVLQQYAMTAMLPAGVVAVAGRRVAAALAFPLAFLLFAVPFGAVFIPPLMDWTAQATVVALRLTGIPVYREGNFFSVPSGHWSVVEACSGVRYLIASVTVGTLYAYLTYRRLWKRALFVVLCVAVPILANWVRAYIIVMVGHLSSMKLAVGADHLVYGWVFFGAVMLPLFWLGSYWRDPACEPGGPAVDSPPAVRSSAIRIAAAALGVVSIAAAWPLWMHYLGEAAADSGAVILQSPAGASGWTADSTPLSSWRPHYAGAAASVSGTYRKHDRSVSLYLAYYRNQRQGAELINSQNVIVQESHPAWANIGETRRTEDFGRGPVALRQTRLRSTGQRLLVWHWFRVSGRDLSNPYLAKALLARDTLLGRGDESSVIIVAAPDAESAEAAQETLRQFAREMLPSINSALAEPKGKLE
jgi:exosortase A